MLNTHGNKIAKLIASTARNLNIYQTAILLFSVYSYVVLLIMLNTHGNKIAKLIASTARNLNIYQTAILLFSVYSYVVKS